MGLVWWGLGSSPSWAWALQEGTPTLSPAAQAEIEAREAKRREHEAQLAVERLLRERESALIRYNHMLPGLRTAAKREQAFREHYPDPKKWAPRFLAVHQQYPQTLGAARALVWIVRHLDRGPVERSARTILLRDHLQRPELAPVCSALNSESRPGARQDLEHLLQHSPIPAVKTGALVQLCRMDLELWQGDQVQAAKARLELRIPRLAAAYAKQSFEGRTGADWASRLQVELAHLSMGQAFVDWRARTLDGEPRALADAHGKVVILFFWKAAAPGCRRALPHIEALRNQQADAPLKVIGVSGDVDVERARRWSRVLKLGFEQWHGPPASDGSLLFGVDQWPTFFVLDAQGKVLAARADWPTAAEAAQAELRRMAKPQPNPEPDEPVPQEEPAPKAL